MSETASSRACCLKHEGDCYSLETFFTSEEYKDLTGAQILETIIPLIEKYDAVSIFKDSKILCLTISLK